MKKKEEKKGKESKDDRRPEYRSIIPSDTSYPS